MSDYLNFDIVVNGKPDAYTVSAVTADGGRTAPESLHWTIDENAHQLLSQIRSGAQVSAQSLANMGSTLFNALFTQRISNAYVAAKANLHKAQQLRIRLIIRPPELIILPWELAYDCDARAYLATRHNTPLVRYLETGKTFQSITVEGPLRILYASANPIDTAQLDLERSLVNLQKSLAMLKAVGHIELTVLPNTTPEKLQRALREGCHIFHFDGHGAFEPTQRQGFLILEDQDRRAVPFPGDLVASFLESKGVRFVLLSACATAQSLPSDPLTGVAQQLILVGNLPAVVAMQFPINDKSAIAFNMHFYEALATGYPIEGAVAEGRKAIMSSLGASWRNRVEWATPALFMQASDGRLWHRTLAPIQLEPLEPIDAKQTQFPPEHPSHRIEPIREAIAQILRSGQEERGSSFLQHVDQIMRYLVHFVELLPPDKQLNELETFVLLAAAHLHGIGQHFPHPEHTIVLRNRLTATEGSDSVSMPQLVRDYCHELSWEWIKNSLENELYPSLGLTPVEPVSEIALVCLGYRDANLNNARYRASGTGSRRMRPALLAAFLSVADMLALASSKPTEKDLKGSKAPLEIQVFEWLHYYLERISIQGGHVHFHYQLPTDDYSLAVRVLLSGPIQLRLKELRRVLSENKVVIALDSSVTKGPVREMPPDVLTHAQTLAYRQLISVIGALGQPSKPQILYHFTGLREQSVLRWSSVEGAERYQCCLFDMKQHLIAQWETTDLEIALPKDQVKPGIQHEWIVYAYRGKRRLRDWEGGIFWIIDEQTAHCIDRQIAWYRALAPFERHLTQGRILANYGLYQEAAIIFWKVLDHGTDMMQLQARQELIGMYQDISMLLDRLERPSRADRYLDKALILAKELQAQLKGEQPEVEE